MKVGQTGTNQVQNQGVTSTSDAKRSGKANVAGDSKKTDHASGDVKADISSQAKEFARAKSIASDTPDVREEKIAALKQKIAEKKYGIDANAIADKMVDEHLKTADLG